MQYKFDVSCIEFTTDEYQYLYSLSRLAPFTPTHNTWEMFNNTHGHMRANGLWYADPAHGNVNVATIFLYTNFFMIQLAHVAVDNSNTKFMHDLMEILFNGEPCDINTL